MKTTHSPLQHVYTNHPLWQKWLQASPCLRAAFYDEFSRFCDYVEKGYDLTSLENHLAKQASKQMREDLRIQARRDLKQTLEANRKTPEFQALLAHPRFNAKNYPGLMNMMPKADVPARGRMR
jgi:uncharacterized membrane protein